MISRRSISIIAFLVCSISLFAQVEEPVQIEGGKKPVKEKPKFSDRLMFGGDIGLSVGTYTYINVSPAIGYRVTDRLIVGLGPIYVYENYKNYNLESSMYGGKVITSFTVLRGTDINPNFQIGNLILHMENEVLNVQPLMYDPFGQPVFAGRQWIDNFLIGGGLSQSLSSRFSVSVLILWDVTNNAYSPYSNPIFRIGFGF
jgi:long-subunit fatty acid transport protein